MENNVKFTIFFNRFFTKKDAKIKSKFKKNEKNID